MDEILEGYDAVSKSLADDFFEELKTGIAKACEHPRFFHFDASGLRRCNLERFPYHFLYDIQLDAIRVWVVRHDRRNPKFGLRRFDR